MRLRIFFDCSTGAQYTEYTIQAIGGLCIFYAGEQDNGKATTAEIATTTATGDVRSVDTTAWILSTVPASSGESSQ